jgi:molybdopterin-synthase adenylyltransferase
VPEFDRYHRQMLLPGFGAEGQARLRNARVLLIGCGALGCSIADLLARAGIGTLTIVDRDVVELTNLQRQTLFDAADAETGLPKAEAARRRLNRINPDVRVHAVVRDFTAANAQAIADAASDGRSLLLLDGTDNFETRYLINDLAVQRRWPYIYGGAVGTGGMAMTVIPASPCLRCIFDEPPASAPTCDTAGVLGPIISIVAAHQASDAIKLSLGRPDLLAGGLHQFDLWTNRHRHLTAGAPRPDCPCCGLRRFEFLDGDRSGAAAALCGQNAVQVTPSTQSEIDLAAYAIRLAPHGAFTRMGDLLLRGTLTRERSESGEPYSLTLFADGRAIVRGTSRPEVARAVYARYIGA